MRLALGPRRYWGNKHVENLFGQLVATGSWIGPFSSLVGAFVFGQLIAWTYERTYQGLSYSRGFSHTLVLVCIAATILVLSMRYSMIAGLGLFGVLSMIRFRTDLKTPRDLVFVMGSACIGVAAGVEGWLVSGLGTATFTLVAVYLSAGPFGSRTRFDGVLRFRVNARGTSGSVIESLLGDFCRRYVLLSTAEGASGANTEHVYQVKFFKNADRGALVAALREQLSAEDTRLMLQDSTSEY